MGEKKMDEAQGMRAIMNVEEFQQKMRNWSKDTIIRRSKDSGFPAYMDGGEWVINRDKAILWFRKREQQN